VGKKQSRKANAGLWTVGGVAVLAVALLIGMQANSNKGSGTTAAGTDITLGGVRNVKGKDTAKVTLVEYGDYL
jgi:hypothetical protein